MKMRWSVSQRLGNKVCQTTKNWLTERSIFIGIWHELTFCMHLDMLHKNGWEPSFPVNLYSGLRNLTTDYCFWQLLLTRVHQKSPDLIPVSLLHFPTPSGWNSWNQNYWKETSRIRCTITQFISRPTVFLTQRTAPPNVLRFIRPVST